MRVLQVASGDFFSTYGGGQVYVKNVVDEMIGQCFDLVVLSFVDKDIAIVRCDYKGIALWEIGTRAKCSDVESLVCSILPDIIHAHSQKALFAKLGECLHIPVVITSHHGGILCPAGTLMTADDCICQAALSHKSCLKCYLANIRTGRSWYPMMRLLPENVYVQFGRFLRRLPFIPFVTPIGGAALSIEGKIKEWKLICDKATTVIAPSHAIADAMCRNGLSREKVVTVPHGIPGSSLPPSNPLNPKDKVRFFYVGRICYVKGIHVLLEAFSCMPNRDMAELHIVGGVGNKGEQRYMKRLQRKYASLNVVWHGKVAPDAVFYTIREFDVLVHPAVFLEVFGLNMAEALMMNKPVLATRCGGAEMQIEDGVNGWLVEPNDVESLCSKMSDIVMSGVGLDVEELPRKVVAIGEHVGCLLKVYEKVLYEYKLSDL